MANKLSLLQKCHNCFFLSFLRKQESSKYGTGSRLSSGRRLDSGFRRSDGIFIVLQEAQLVDCIRIGETACPCFP
jgi:hypothetical protein